jgi:hypothetical protein
MRILALSRTMGLGILILKVREREDISNMEGFYKKGVYIPGSHHEITGKRLPDRKVEA